MDASKSLLRFEGFVVWILTQKNVLILNIDTNIKLVRGSKGIIMSVTAYGTIFAGHLEPKLSKNVFPIFGGLVYHARNYEHICIFDTKIGARK